MDPNQADMLIALVNEQNQILQGTVMTPGILSTLKWIGALNLCGFGWMIGSQLWRNLILAKNQRHYW